MVNALNRMTSWTDGTNTEGYAHRAADHVRVSKTSGGVTINHLVLDNRETCEYQNGTLTKATTWGSYIDEALGSYPAGQSPVFYHADALYSTHALTDSTGSVVEKYKYEAFGERSILAPDNTPRTQSQYAISCAQLDGHYPSPPASPAAPTTPAG